MSELSAARIDNATVPGFDGPVSISIADGRIAAIAPYDAVAVGDDDAPVLDAGGLLVLPGLINAHAHVDKTLWGGPWVPIPRMSSVAERIAHERRFRDVYGLPNPDYISALLEQMIATGTTVLRTHTDVDPGVGLRGIATVAEAAERYAHAIDIEQVAFPQGGLITNPGTLELLRDAVAAGATVIGGLDPAGFDNAPNAHLDAIFDLAAETGAGIDIHLHDPGSLGAWEIQLVIDLTKHHGLGGKVTVSHAFGIDHAPTQRSLLEQMAAAGISLATAAGHNVPVPPLVDCAEIGVTLAGGTDGINDLWGPHGEGDMLRRAMIIAYRNTARTDPEIELAFDTVTAGAARMLGLESYGLVAGAPADLVAVDARCIAEAVTKVPERAFVMKRGRVVARDGAYLPLEA